MLLRIVTATTIIFTWTISTTVWAADVSGQSGEDYFKPREPDGLPFFTPVPSSTPVTDAALTAATSGTESSKRLVRQERGIAPLEAAIRGPMAGFLKDEDRKRIIAWLKSGASQSEYETGIRPILEKNCLGCHSTAAAGTTRPDLSNFAALQKVIQTNSNATAEISRNEAAASIFGKHNLTPTGIATGEICAFCHTPQGVENTVTAPLWNRSLSSLSDYKAFSTLGSSLAAWTGSVSIACLSCHDGTQAPNILINTPGKDGTGADSINGTRTDSSLFLKGHHPVGMPFGGGGPTQAMPGAPLNLEDFHTPSYSGTGNGTVWWMERGGRGRQKTDLLLFTRTETTNNELLSRPYVECASCHDPHNYAGQTFLRVANTGGSALCLTCHAK